MIKNCLTYVYLQTISIKLYANREAVLETNVSTKVVMELIEPYLDFGRNLVVDNWYTTVELAELLGQRKTYLTGTLSSNRKSNPKEVIRHKVKKGEIFSLRSNTNVIVLKWKDIRDLLLCGTKDTNKMVNIVKRKVVQKLEVVLNYNKGKGSIDLADQKAAFFKSITQDFKVVQKSFG